MLSNACDHCAKAINKFLRLCIAFETVKIASNGLNLPKPGETIQISYESAKHAKHLCLYLTRAACYYKYRRQLILNADETKATIEWEKPTEDNIFSGFPLKKERRSKLLQKVSIKIEDDGRVEDKERLLLLQRHREETLSRAKDADLLASTIIFTTPKPKAFQGNDKKILACILQTP